MTPDERRDALLRALSKHLRGVEILPRPGEDDLYVVLYGRGTPGAFALARLDAYLDLPAIEGFAATLAHILKRPERRAEEYVEMIEYISDLQAALHRHGLEIPPPTGLPQ